MPETLRIFAQDLVNEGIAVWLIGSRANNTAKEASDWDILVFGNKELFEKLAAQKPIENIDLLVVCDGNAFRSPWDQTKSGSLLNWKWCKVSEIEATYWSTKWPDGGSEKRAKRLFY